ncbi:hypothetical protein M427DRAFT_57172 [Gonapodya prolifera JEL478]|uniref:Uncharacterized protein n=1 Tax=Gonapodya prolifera (strain JEL478) TaxID=1344416 RepID=A0A139AE43_GONPJ|nr:hypothetical protein M427DRAFT_57172 [Gonapodya prolifera JEL478]|eukprot:KXS15037.1 hypothetical protein M427DRAFT_57172 [Gonapodya prolifera JEL478]
MSVPSTNAASASLSPSHTPSAPPSTPLLSTPATTGAQARPLDLADLIARRATLLFDGDAAARVTPTRQRSAPGSASNGLRRGVSTPLLDHQPGAQTLARENTGSRLFMTLDHLPRPSQGWELPELPSLDDRTGASAGLASGLGFAESPHLARNHSDGTGIIHGRILHGLSPDTTGQTSGPFRHVIVRSEVEGMEDVQSAAAPARDDEDVAMESVDSSPPMPTFPSWVGKAERTIRILPSASTSSSFAAIPFPFPFRDTSHLNPPSPDLAMMDTLSEFPFPKIPTAFSCALPPPSGSPLSTHPPSPRTFSSASIFAAAPPFSRKRAIESTLTPPASPSETPAHAHAKFEIHANAAAPGFLSLTSSIPSTAAGVSTSTSAHNTHSALRKRSRTTHDTATGNVQVDGFFGAGGDGGGGSGVTGAWGRSHGVIGTPWMSMERDK